MILKKKPDQDMIARLGVFAGVVEIVFILLAGFLMAVGNSVFTGSAGGSLLAVMGVLTLFVLSAGVSAVLLFGYPLFLLLNKRNEEAALFVGSVFTALFGGFIILLLLGSIF